MKKNLYTILFCLCVFTFFCCAVFLFDDITNYLAQLSEQKSTYATLRKAVLATPSHHSDKKLHSTPDSTPKNIPENTILPTIDFSALQKKNKDAYAWIFIPDTPISYPIMQHPHLVNYYLSHNFDHTVGYPGCIYSEFPSRKNFQDEITILYGHNMRDGTMFGSLRTLENENFIRRKKYIYILIKKAVLQYRIRKATVFPAVHIINNYGNSKQGKLRLLTDLKLSTSKYSKKPVLILSTCNHKDRRTRFLIVATLSHKRRIIH